MGNWGGKNLVVVLICAMVKSREILGMVNDGHATFNRHPYNRYIDPTSIFQRVLFEP